MRSSELAQPVKINLGQVGHPKTLRPELLLHPPIPSSLWGINPRRLLGKGWWKARREEVYESNNRVCMACGDPDARPLQAHECYEFDYENHIAVFTEIVPLCYNCHLFIHWRTAKPSAVKKILQHGVRVLLEAGLQVPDLQAKLSGLEVPTDRTLKRYTSELACSLAYPRWKLDLRALGDVAKRVEHKRVIT